MNRGKSSGGAGYIRVSGPVVINVSSNLHSSGFKGMVKNSGLQRILTALNRYIFFWGLQIYLIMLP